MFYLQQDTDMATSDPEGVKMVPIQSNIDTMSPLGYISYVHLVLTRL